MAQDEPPNVSVRAFHSIFMPSMMCTCAFVGCSLSVSSCLSFSCSSPSLTSSLPHSTCTLPSTPSSVSTPPRVKTTAPPHNEEYCPMAIYHPLTDADWHARRSTKVLKEKTGRNCTSTTKKWVRRPVSRSQMKTKKRKPFGKWRQPKKGERILWPRRQRQHLGEKQYTIGTMWRAPQRPDRGTGQSVEVCGEFVLDVCIGPRILWSEWPPTARAGFLHSFVEKTQSGRAFGPTWTRRIVCVCAQHPWSGMYQGSTGRMASSFSSW